MKIRKISLVLFALIMTMAIVFTGCSSNQNNGGTTQQGNTNEISGSIVALGSSAMQPLVDEAAKQFTTTNPKAQIQVQGGGSGTGLSQVSSGGAAIGNSDVFAEEKITDSAVLSTMVDHKIAVVGMAAVANKGVGVDNLTKQQLIDIFTGKVKNWKEVGGADVAVTLVNRPASSGTRATFVKYALDGAQEAEGISEDASGTVKNIVAQTPGAIGYLAFSYFDDSIIALKLDGVEPTEANVTTGKFPVWAYEHSYTKGEPTGLTKAFIDYMMSDDVQNNIVPKLGYIPATKMQIERDAQGNIKNK